MVENAAQTEKKKKAKFMMERYALEQAREQPGAANKTEVADEQSGITHRQSK